MINQTSAQYDQVIADCRNVFARKNKDYGPSWRIMRVSSIVDQIYIKAARIRTIEEKGKSRIEENVESEYAGIINYCVMGLIQLDTDKSGTEPTMDTLLKWYDDYILTTKNLMQDKNHDYGEIWRDMLISTFTDMLLVRVNRIRQIMENDGKTLDSEGVDSNLMDMINYSVFALIRLGEKKDTK